MPATPFSSYTFRMKKIRLDELMVQRGLVDSVADALPLVVAHEVKVGDEYAASVAQLVAPDAAVSLKGKGRFVSRGGDKLQAAIDHFGQEVGGLHCIDIGSSTGGFSDCLLQAGADHVTCVDVGYGILADAVRNDVRTTVFERTNIRTAKPEELGAPFDLLVADLSFIGLAQLAPTFAQLCKPGSVFLALVKPQFESAHEETEGGLVTDPAVRARTIEEVCTALEQAGFTILGTMESPVPGKKAGNIEYFIQAVF